MPQIVISTLLDFHASCQGKAAYHHIPLLSFDHSICGYHRWRGSVLFNSDDIFTARITIDKNTDERFRNQRGA